MQRLEIAAVTMAITIIIHSAAAFAGPLDRIRFIKIAPQDTRAVIKEADGKLRVIKPGDVIADGVTVKDITTGRIVLEEKTDKGVETVMVRMESDGQRIERLSKMPENRPVLAAPALNIK